MQNKTLKGNRIIYNFISGVLEVSVRSQQKSDPTTTGQNRNRDTNDTRCDVPLTQHNQQNELESSKSLESLTYSRRA